MRGKRVMFALVVIVLILSILFGLNVFASNEPDFDGDGMPDLWEKQHQLKFDIFDADADPDNDGLNNLQEYRLGTDPNLFDSQASLDKARSDAATPQPATNPEDEKYTKILLYSIIGVGSIMLILIVFQIIKSKFSKPKQSRRPYPMNRPMLRRPMARIKSLNNGKKPYNETNKMPPRNEGTQISVKSVTRPAEAAQKEPRKEKPKLAAPKKEDSRPAKPAGNKDVFSKLSEMSRNRRIEKIKRQDDD